MLQQMIYIFDRSKEMWLIAFGHNIASVFSSIFRQKMAHTRPAPGH